MRLLTRISVKSQKIYNEKVFIRVKIKLGTMYILCSSGEGGTGDKDLVRVYMYVWLCPWLWVGVVDDSSAMAASWVLYYVLYLVNIVFLTEPVVCCTHRIEHTDYLHGCQPRAHGCEADYVAE